jgi:hypothetical protein
MEVEKDELQAARKLEQVPIVKKDRCTSGHEDVQQK